MLTRCERFSPDVPLAGPEPQKKIAKSERSAERGPAVFNAKGVFPAALARNGCHL
jgi:hypothetical protein